MEDFCDAMWLFDSSGTSYMVMTCSKCGALIAESQRGTHIDWHQKLTRNGADLPAREDYSEG